MAPPLPNSAHGDQLICAKPVMFSNLPAVEYIRAGKLHALAVTTAAGLDEFPDVPTIGEFVPGYEASAWYGIGAPKGTPADIVDKLNKETNAIDFRIVHKPWRAGWVSLSRPEGFRYNVED